MHACETGRRSVPPTSDAGYLPTALNCEGEGQVFLGQYRSLPKDWSLAFLHLPGVFPPVLKQTVVAPLFILEPGRPS